MVDEHLSLANLEVQGQKFLERLRTSAALNLDYWTRDKSGKPNLRIEAFLAAIPAIPEPTVTWEPRLSEKGKNAHHAEYKVWFFEFDLEVLGKRSSYFLKGYFYTRWKLGGVTIQSFREILPDPIPMRPRKK